MQTSQAIAEILPATGQPPELAEGEGVAAVIVVFNPDRAQLLENLAAVACQAEKLIVVDNGCSDLLHQEICRRYPTLVWRKADGNLGVAAAQNLGIEEARRRGARQVLFLDQDSTVQIGMMAELQRLWSDLQGNGARLGAIGPCYIDPTCGLSAKLERRQVAERRGAMAVKVDGCVEVDFLIASGSLVSLDALAEVGDMDPGLFIDHVDTDWCHRARALGFRLFGATQARMHHSMGERRKRIWLLRWRNVALHRPFRYYYIFRNSVLLYRRPSTPRGWVLQDTIRLAGLFVVCGLCNRPRLETFTAMLHGLADGLRGRSGPLSTR